MVLKKNNSNMKEYVKLGFGVGIGSMLASMIFIFIGMLFFIPGLILLNKERKKPLNEQNDTNKKLAYLLMIIGSIIGFGMGFNFIATNSFEDFDF